jgi:hypothetical protein
MEAIWRERCISLTLLGMTRASPITSISQQVQAGLDRLLGMTTDHAFLFGNEAPYFATRPNRIYMAAIWCLGLCWSVSPENRAGSSIGRLHGMMPWVVVGYQ